MTEWMRQAVDQVYHHQIGIPAQWSPEQTELFLSLVTQRLDDQAATLALELGEQAVQSWTQQHHGQPDHETTVGLHETALQNAREAIVRQSLYDLIPQPPEGHDSPPALADIPWTQRWRHLTYRAEPSEQIEELADHLWPDRSAMFRVKAAYLLATRLEENRAIPTAPGHRLTHDLGVEVAEAMTAEGYPPE
ncbi:hypothetical protein PXJ67_00115 (plasmid) [Mycobacteroides chelonae]|uniref:hypothetical protein n=1 Tax=Mycobacteriaceae TaxID=1762 RepID=UPI000AEC9E30|nr:MULTISPECIES: hypothetical protein [Mycobacteriaceae]WED89823.1 hypothetical protein PXJ67_00115 [Mycobacteroides chelonae]